MSALTTTPFASVYEELANPNISWERLEELSHHKDSFVRFAVARNKKTPPNTLLFLAMYDPVRDVRFVAEQTRADLFLKGVDEKHRNSN